jgi:outer membrane protein assembly factor BamB
MRVRGSRASGYTPHMRASRPTRRPAGPGARPGKAPLVLHQPISYQERRRASRRRLFRLLRTALLALVLLGVCGWFAWARLAPKAKPPAAAAVAPPAGTRIISGTFLGNESRDFYGPGPAPTALQLLWKVRIGSGWTRRKEDEKRVLWSGTGWTGQCTMVQDAGKTWLLVGGYDHNLRKIDAATGEVAWKCAFDDVIKATNTVLINPHPTSDADRIIVVSGSRRGSDYVVGDPRIAPLRAVSFTTGQELWRLPLPKTDNYSQDVDSSPLLIGSTLYAPIEPGYVYRLDPFHTTAWGSYRSPVVLGRSPRLYTALDALHHPDIGGYNVAIEASPARIGDTLYIASGSGHIYGLALPDLRVAWDFKTGSDIDGTTVVTSDKKLLAAIERQYIKGPGGVFLLDPSKSPTSAPIWYFPTQNRGYSEWQGGVIGSVTTNERSHPAGTRPRLAAFMSVDGDLYVTAIDSLSDHTTTGPDGTTIYPRPSLVFRERIGGSISTPVIVGDTIVAASSEKKVRLYRIEYLPSTSSEGIRLTARDGSEWRVRVVKTAEFLTGGPVESTPLVAGGRVYIGCRDGFLYCLGGA